MSRGHSTDYRVHLQIPRHGASICRRSNPGSNLAANRHHTAAFDMDPDTEVTFEFVPVIRQYKSGRVERLHHINPVPPSVDAATGVTSKDVTIDATTGLWARLYLPDLSTLPTGGGANIRLPILLYFHGGGLVVGSAADAPEHAFLNRLAARAGALAVSVEYRLAPEHPVPACYDDAWAALLWATAAATPDSDPWIRDHGDASRVFVLGFSSGGNIAHNLTLRAGTETSPRGASVEGMALIHPYFLSPPGRDEAAEREDAWVRGKLVEMWAFACGGRTTTGPDDPRVNPVAEGAPSLRRLGCGRVLVCLAEDALAREGEAYYNAVVASGWPAGEAELLDSRPADHEFHLREPESAKAVLLMDRLVAFVAGEQSEISLRRAMAAIPVAPPPVAADDEIVYESMPCIRIYKNRVERYFGSEFVAASTDEATGVASKDVVISPNVSARLYLPRLDDGGAKLPVLVYYHGGGFCLGSAFNPTFHAYFNTFTALANVLVVSVEYRLAPEHPVPAAYADGWEALAWVVSHLADPSSAAGDRDPWIAGHADFARLYLGGESAGSNIAHHMAMRVAAEGLAHGAQIRGLVMIHPYFLGTDKVPSDDINAEARESLGSLWRVMCPTTTGDDDPLINPLVDGAPSLASLACGRVLVCVGEGDVLRDRGRAYYDRLKASGWQGEAEIWQAPEKGHTFHLLEPSCDEAIAQDKVISDFLNR
ncbi:hypothetical protein HU200_006564 [Digitaria exilis]|uniref:Alpha/beta hydrolase fold-3 domain-containing protein n=1 Tax=Digitaria exilis TaxID=1010633 RepID=A0A835FSH5_9POAL|nr:hypothetical protein HU200_006564 [Digitaria exilis]CAB3483252.1 unnamed protein product [Digitaria exilis]